MKFQIGDKVLLIHSNEEGEVVEIINSKMVSVDVGGVQFPVYTDQLEFPYFKRFTAKKPAPVEKKKVYVEDLKKEKVTLKTYNVESGIWLSLLPVFDKDVFDDDIVDYFKLFLVNNTDTAYRFSYQFLKSTVVDFQLEGELLPFNDLYLHDVPFEAMNDAPRFDFEFSLKESNRKKVDYFETGLKIKTKQLFQRIEALLFNQQANFSYLLMETYPDKEIRETVDLSKLTAAGYKLYDAGTARQHIPPARSVVDLHIEKITNNRKGLSNFEILTLQLNEFEKYYELAVLHHLAHFIVIHGVGEGRLRDEIHSSLRLKKEVKSFVNQYHPLYGFGATEIYFK